jgi:hypothetical protein
MYRDASLSVLIFDNFVSTGTFGIRDLRVEKAEFREIVLLRSFFPVPVPVFLLVAEVAIGL